MRTLQDTNQSQLYSYNMDSWQTVLVGCSTFLKPASLIFWLIMDSMSGLVTPEETDTPGEINICRRIVWNFGNGRKYITSTRGKSHRNYGENSHTNFCWSTLINFNVIFVLVWPEHESWENSHTLIDRVVNSHQLWCNSSLTRTQELKNSHTNSRSSLTHATLTYNIPWYLN